MVRKGEVIRGEDGKPVVFWPPIFTEEEAARLRAALKPRTATGPRTPRASRILSGLLTCSGCGARLRVGSSGNGLNYRCSGKTDGPGCARPVAINAENLDAYVTKRFLDTMGKRPVVRLVEESRDVVALGEVEVEIREIGRRIIEPGADVVGLSAALSALNDRREALEAQETTSRIVATGQTLREAWKEAGTLPEVDAVAARRRLLADNLAGAVILPGQRGRRGLDAHRVALMWQPLAVPDGTLTPGRIVAEEVTA